MNIDVEMGKEMASEYELGQVRLGEFQLYTNGEELYRKLFDDINDAEKYIYIHFYIVGKDEISQEFLQLLEKKASSGVEVKLSVDRVGGYKLKKKVISRLKENGVKFTFSKKPKLKNMFYSLHQRNHRRIVTIDGKVSYVGALISERSTLDKIQSLGHGVIITCASMVRVQRIWKESSPKIGKKIQEKKCLYMKVYLH